MDTPGRLIITGPGHSGTNLVLEAVRMAGEHSFFPDDGIHTEDREIVSRMRSKEGLPKNYATKLATENTMISENFFTEVMDKYPDMQIVFCIRNPIDVALARIFKFKGKEPYDAKGNIKQLNFASDILEFLNKKYPTRTMVFYMPEYLENDVRPFALQELCHFLAIPYIEQMTNAHKLIRIKEKQIKYKGEIDPRQKDLLKYRKELFNDFWEKEPFKGMLEEVITYFDGGNFKVWENKRTYPYWLVLMEI